MVDVKMQMLDEADFDTFLSKDMSFEGDMKFSKNMIIKGTFNGKIDSTGNLYIDKDAQVNADIKVSGISVRGTVQGNIVAGAVVELHSTAKMTGDITSPAFAVESGAEFSGMSKVKKA